MVRRKWSGHEVPSAASGSRSALQTNSSTLALSSKWPSLYSSWLILPRSTGIKRCARAARSCAGKGADLAPPNAGCVVLAASQSSARLMMAKVVS
ncbi:hypothetical protein D3C72_1994900 [compost metagenome]